DTNRPQVALVHSFTPGPMADVRRPTSDFPLQPYHTRRSTLRVATPRASSSRPPEVCDHRFARLIERGVRGHAVRLADAVDADAIGRRRLVRFQLGAELARDHAAGLVDLHDPCAAQ